MADEVKKNMEANVESPAEPAEAVPVSEETEGVKKRSKKGKRQVFRGRASIQCTYNNTIVTLTDQNGAVLGWSSSGHLGFKGAKKSTPYAATQVVADVTEKVKKYGLSELDVFVKGVGSGREASVRALSNNGFSLLSIKDITPLPHNGCRPKRPRRI
jgi:small subunit ribosomal protein S11